MKSDCQCLECRLMTAILTEAGRPTEDGVEIRNAGAVLDALISMVGLLAASMTVADCDVWYREVLDQRAATLDPTSESMGTIAGRA